MHETSRRATRGPRRERVAASLAVVAMLLVNLLASLYQFGYDDEVRRVLGGLRVNVQASHAGLNASTWVVPSFQAEPFLFEIETYDEGNPWRPNTTYSVAHHDMGTTAWFKANCTEWGEWGYAFHHLTGGQLDGAGVAHYGGYPSPPANKRAAYDYMRQHVINFTAHLNGNVRPWVSFNGHYPYHHYAAEFGFDKIGTEIGENMESYQMLMAFNRGAARQYGLPWFVDVSAWYGPGITEYNDPPVFPQHGGPNNGHSLSLYRRSYYMAYMAGTSRLVAEGGYFNYFHIRRPAGPGGLMDLTPLGEVGRELAHFARDHPARGIPWTPVAIYIDELHGTTGLGEPLAFNAIPYTRGDWMTHGLLDVLFPGGWRNDDTETCQLVNNDHGDIVDIILQNASAAVLASYPVIVASGDIVLGAAERARLAGYVAGGGTLVVNDVLAPALQQAFTEHGLSLDLGLGLVDRVRLVPAGNGNGGNVIVSRVDQGSRRLGAVLREIVPQVSPFSLASPTGAPARIQHMINRNEHGWVLTLINNDGITKRHHEAPRIDPSKQQDVRVTLNPAFIAATMDGQQLVRVNDWIARTTRWEAGTGAFPGITVSLPPGELAVLEFTFS